MQTSAVNKIFDEAIRTNENLQKTLKCSIECLNIIDQYEDEMITAEIALRRIKMLLVLTSRMIETGR